jgi:hypothetical protein
VIAQDNFAFHHLAGHRFFDCGCVWLQPKVSKKGTPSSLRNEILLGDKQPNDHKIDYANG